MRILFLGGMFPKIQEDTIYKNSIGSVQTAADFFQWNLIDGLEAHLAKPVDLISSRFIGYYPQLYNKAIIKPLRFNHHPLSEDYAIGFINVKGIEIYDRMRRLYTPVKKWIIKQLIADELIVIIVYSATPQFMNVIGKLKKEFSFLHICLIVPDLPEYMKMTNKNTLARKIYDKYMEKPLHNIVYKNMKFVDSFVLLTKEMKEYLNVGERRYVVVEGVINENRELISNSLFFEKVDIQTILYTGTLAAKYGIMELAKAFTQISNKSIRLIICGEGDAKDDIDRLGDDRIELKGVISHDSVLKLQQKATLLINPRRNNEEYTKYSFPSKTMEYMQSKRPVLMYRLDGIPSEYDEYLLYFDDYPDKCMSDIIEEIINKDPEELKDIGMKASEFVCKYKTKILQGEKILNMIGKDSN